MIVSNWNEKVTSLFRENGFLNICYETLTNNTHKFANALKKLGMKKEDVLFSLPLPWQVHLVRVFHLQRPCLLP